MRSYKLIIFDWDGTLMDSVGRIVSSMQAAAKSAKLSIPSDHDAKQIIGLSLPKAIEILFPKRTEAQAEFLIAQYKLQYVELNTTPTPLFDNALNLLTRLRTTDKLLAVATGKGREGLQRVWQVTDTEQYFHTSRCADEAHSKPDPQMLHSLLTELNIEAKQAVMIGDTSHDLEMARRAGVDSIGITLGVHDKDVLSQYQPKAIVDSLFELETLLIS
jgi:phosphoglycolate phosphatase